MKPTEEQKRIIEDFADTRVLKVNAVAGSGKTSTLEMLAKAYKKPSLYMAFNKGIKEEADARFPSHVECRTTHSLAFSGFGRDLMHKINRPKGTYKNVAGTPLEISKFYGIPDAGDVPSGTVALLSKIAAQRYEQSDHNKITKKNLPFQRIKEVMENAEEVSKDHLTKEILKYAKKLWEDRCDPLSDVMTTHDTYLKLWQLSKPRLDFEILYLDEAQDTNPVVLDVVKRQTHCKVVYVGDTFQSIYQFRGAINAMEMITAPTRMLSKSFRYGQKIADVASEIIKNEVEIEGSPNVNSTVDGVDTSEPYTKLYRTNGKLLQDAVQFVSQGKKVTCEIDVRGFINLLSSVESLMKGDLKKVKHEEVLPYKNWQEFLEACEDQPELKRARNIVAQDMTGFYIHHLWEIYNAPKKEHDVLLTTAHKSKGREWDQVIIADDFPEIDEDLKGQEMNLLYVAVTRAQGTLEMPVGYEAQQ